MSDNPKSEEQTEPAAKEQKAEAPEQTFDYTTIIRLIQQFGGLIVAIGTLISLGGYIVVHSYLWLLTDLQVQGVVSAQYLAAGTGFLIFTTTLISFIWISFRANLIQMIGLLVILSFGVLYLLVILNLRSDSSLEDGFYVLLVPLIIFGLVMNALRFIYRFMPQFIKQRTPSISMGDYIGKILTNSQYAVTFISALFIYVILFGFFYGIYVYRNIPRNFGGGLFSSAALVLNEPEKWEILGILDEEIDRMTGPLCLITELTDSYLFINPSNGLIFTVPSSAIVSIVDVEDDEICSVGLDE